MIGKIIEVTAVLIGLYLVLVNSDSFGTVAGASSSAYSGAVKTLQGR